MMPVSSNARVFRATSQPASLAKAHVATIADDDAEVLHLHIDDIGPTHATVLNGKGGKSRRVPLTAELRADLVKRASGRHGFIFADPKPGKVPTQEATSVAYGRLAKKLGLKGVSHHV